MTARELYEWRQKGATYQEMADVEGISRQAVYLKVKSYEKKLEGNRGRRFDINKIVYKGIYEFFKTDTTMNIYKFAEAVFGGSGPEIAKVKRFLLGEAETLFKIKHIKRMLELTEMPFEELFERR